MKKGLLVLTVILGLLSIPTSAEAAGGQCKNITGSVALAPGLPTTETIAGTFCKPKHWAPGPHHIDILVHGATYNRTYWDWPQQQPQYSYVKRTLQAGRATFAYDTLGAGASSQPTSTAVTPEAQAYILHQIVQRIRAHGFPQVTTIGHSFGSIITIHEAASYQDVDRLVVTGMLHATGSGAALAATSFYPAAFDPQFSGTVTDPGYLTSVPGVRDDLFYATTADPTVIAFDESHKDIVSGTFFGLGLGEVQAPAVVNISQHITAPVLTISGAQDVLNCGPLLDCTNQSQVQANEAPYYPAAASLTAVTVLDTGHNINLHPSAGTAFAIIDAWITSH